VLCSIYEVAILALECVCRVEEADHDRSARKVAKVRNKEHADGVRDGELQGQLCVHKTIQFLDKLLTF